MRILRAHSYDAVERVRRNLGRLPEHWRQIVHPWQYIILPDDLKPSWIGLTLRDDAELARANDPAMGDRTFDMVGGWCASDDHAYWVRNVPHIFLNHASVMSACHESGHALARSWHAPIEALYRPEQALYPYMAVDADEFFACGVAAFCREERDDRRYNRLDLAKKAPDLYAYLLAKQDANT
jgi:hypothetical protein